MKLKCLIIDDEPLAQEVLSDFVQACPELELVAVHSDALEATELLKKESIHLLFLDINMPKLSGIGFVKSLKEPPLFIFITAYPQYAIDGFEIDAVDYLLKPVSFERFRAAVNRALDRFNQRPEKKAEHLMLRSNKKDYRVALDDIFYLEARGDYVRFVLADQALMVHGRLKDFIGQLPGEDFVQIHKSFVVACSKVVYLEANQLDIGVVKLPVSLTYRNQLLTKLHP